MQRVPIKHVRDMVPGDVVIRRADNARFIVLTMQHEEALLVQHTTINETPSGADSGGDTGYDRIIRRTTHDRVPI